MVPVQVNAMVHSKNDIATAYIIEKVEGANEYVAFYDGKLCSAIFNVFTGLFYVDDVYGIILQK